MIGYKILDDTIEWWLMENPSITHIGEIKQHSDNKWYFSESYGSNDHLFTTHDLINEDKYDYVSKVLGYEVNTDGIFPYVRNREDVLKIFQSFANTKEKSYRTSVRRRSRIKLKFTI